MSAAAVASQTVASTREVAQAAKSASRVLAPLDEARRNAALEAMAVALEAASAELFAANAEDLEIAAAMSGEEKLLGSGESHSQSLVRGGVGFLGGMLLCGAALAAQAALLYAIAGHGSCRAK